MNDQLDTRSRSTQSTAYTLSGCASFTFSRVRAFSQELSFVTGNNSATIDHQFWAFRSYQSTVYRVLYSQKMKLDGRNSPLNRRIGRSSQVNLRVDRRSLKSWIPTMWVN